MNLNVLDNSTLWVAISFVLFLILVFKPLMNSLSQGLEKKISELKKNLDESKTLKLEAQRLHNEQLTKQKENELIIKRIDEETKREIDNIKNQFSKEIEMSMIRKINNYNQISSQMENELKEELRNKVINKVTKYTEVRIKNNLSKKHNSKLIEESLKNIPKHLI